MLVKTQKNKGNINVTNSEKKKEDQCYDSLTCK